MIFSRRVINTIGYFRLYPPDLWCTLDALYAPIPYPCRRYPLTPPPSHTRMPQYLTPAGAVIGQKTRFFVCAQYKLPGYGFLSSQSQRRISPSSSNHGVSPNDSVNGSDWPLPDNALPHTPVSRSKLRQDVRDALPHRNETRGGRGCQLFEFLAAKAKPDFYSSASRSSWW
jgi:hypothetical protein